MNSITKPSFWRAYRSLPRSIQRQARKAYRLWRENPAHPSLVFKQVKPTRPPLYSARITQDFRALGVLQDDTVIWLWIGGHDEYERRLK